MKPVSETPAPVPDRAKRLQAITLLHDVAEVKAGIKKFYGFVPSDDYCRDLIAFVDAMTAGAGK
jgi:hypothetical protein